MFWRNLTFLLSPPWTQQGDKEPIAVPWSVIPVLLDSSSPGSPVFAASCFSELLHMPVFCSYQFWHTSLHCFLTTSCQLSDLLSKRQPQSWGYIDQETSLLARHMENQVSVTLLWLSQKPGCQSLVRCSESHVENFVTQFWSLAWKDIRAAKAV